MGLMGTREVGLGLVYRVGEGVSRIDLERLRRKSDSWPWILRMGGRHPRYG